ncbi:MAG: ATP-dependent DNA helicase, partial [Erysipelotrichia bacterium]|nr:ATP-dependent DNA helicase [Erysipelotrichia bacterium]
AKHFNERGLPGKDYAYTNPGMNKVMQAVGRVIRGEKDHGAVLLVDERYMQSQYQDLFKKEWSDYRVVFNDDELEDELQTFFINDDKTNANKGQL